VGNTCVLRVGESIQINDRCADSSSMCTGPVLAIKTGADVLVGIAIKAASSAKFRHPTSEWEGTPIAV